jgi:2,4-dienoyl-CoA reductase-like NADH-dependent reductase (Old Yellow Enzyme family)
VVKDLIAPSDVEMERGKPARAMTADEIQKVIEAFAQAALRVKKSELDAVEIHCAHLYLLSQFTTADINQRTDSYGGSAENRFRILKEIILAVRGLCGPNFPILVKINSNSPKNDELYWQDLQYMAAELDKLDIEAIEISGYDFNKKAAGSHLFYLERTAKLKQMVSIPVMAIGGILSPADIKAVMDKGIELIGLCRPLITQPNFLDLAAKGEASRCILCNQCMTVPYTKGVSCAFHAV